MKNLKIEATKLFFKGAKPNIDNLISEHASQLSANKEDCVEVGLELGCDIDKKRFLTMMKSTYKEYRIEMQDNKSEVIFQIYKL